MKKILTYICFAFCSLIVLNAQKSYLSDIRIKNEVIKKQDDQLHISMDIDISDLKMSRQDMIMLTPVLISNENGAEQSLPYLVITGSIRDKIVKRQQRLNIKPVFDSAPLSITKRRNGKMQAVTYNVTIPFEKWMQNAALQFNEAISGCADCFLGKDQQVRAQRILPEPFVPSYKIIYIVPEVEPIKRRSATHAAHFNYKVARHELLPNFGNNAYELAEVDKVITLIKKDKDLTVQDLTISGYASPEGSSPSNLALSQRRANTFANYLVSRYSLDRNQFKVNWYGEDWKGLEAAVKASNLADKDEIINIIHTETNEDARDAQLQRLSGGNTYRTLLQQYYPPLRRNEYTISYIARAFNVEEAKKIIKTKPQLLSLNEMYLVAQTYSPESKEFKEVFDIAARLFPEDPIAITNAAASDIEGGNMQAAINRLLKIEEDSRVWNNLGVAYGRLGQTDKAKHYFEKAAANNDKDAVENLAQLNRYINQ